MASILLLRYLNYSTSDCVGWPTIVACIQKTDKITICNDLLHNDGVWIFFQFNSCFCSLGCGDVCRWGETTSAERSKFNSFSDFRNATSNPGTEFEISRTANQTACTGKTYLGSSDVCKICYLFSVYCFTSIRDFHFVN